MQMSKFVQFNNGTIRRVRGTIGGCKAWQQHAHEKVWGDRCGRRRLTDKILGDLAADQMRDILVNGSELQGKHKHQRQQRPAPVVTTKAAAILAKVTVRPRIKVTINGSGTMVAVPLN